MKMCDRCPGAGGCLLNYIGEACKHWRKENAPEVLARILCTAEFCECCDYKKDGGVCHYIEEHPDGLLFDGCVEAAKRWLGKIVEKL